MGRVLRWGLLLLLVLLLGGLGVLSRLRAGPGPATGERTFAGLDGEVEILWDSVGIPQIWASSVEDALRAQGFVHVQDRLWQMEFFRRVARGRLSEVFGEPTVATDRFLRVLDMEGAARKAAAALTPEVKAMLDAYTEGVNAAIESWKGPLPPEFVLLGIEPEPWEIVDALAIEKIMSWDLAQYNASVSMLRAARELGVDRMSEIRPGYPEWGSTILDDTIASDHVAPAVFGVLPSEALIASAQLPPAGQPLLEAVNSIHASNAWVVGGERSASGKPLLSNDMHLGLDQPNIWYLVGLHAPGLQVVGMSIAGTPMVTVGHSDAVAWGFTNAGLDDTEFFLERVDPADTTRYLTPTGSAPFEVRTEEIFVKGREAPESLIVRETRHGPIVSQVEAAAEGHLLAFQWVASGPVTTFEGVMGMNRAGNAAEFLDALSKFSTPHQNAVFADTAGAWGYWMTGSIPDRPTGVPPHLPVPGWTGEYDWQGFIPFEDHPHVLAPERGFIATANNRQGWGPVTDRISPGRRAMPWRADRITELLDAREVHNAESMLQIQLDVVSRRALRYRDRAVAGFRAAGLDEAATALEGWGGDFDLESEAAGLFRAWYEGVARGLRRRIYEGGSTGYVPADHLDELIASGDLPPGLSASAASEAWAEVGVRPWGELQRLSLDHPLASVPALERLFGFGRRGIPRAGSGATVNVSSGGGWDGEGWVATNGPSERHVADLADLDGTGGFILPGGQSGYPRGRHADDQIERWRSGDLVPIPISRPAAEARTVGRLTLRPR